MENKALKKKTVEMNHLLNGVGEVYGELNAIYQTMTLVLDDMYENLKMPDVYLDEIKMDRHVMDRQTAALNDCIKNLERIAPRDCYLG